MEPWQLIGMGYRLGANPESHGVTDCLGLSRAVLKYYGVGSPEASRSWYRRMRAGDWSVFPEQLGLWGETVLEPRIGAIALCNNRDGSYAMGAWYEEGWLIFNPEKLISWQPRQNLEVAAIYCQSKRISAIS